ncbi:MAG: hypothetical protein ACYSWP_16600 [Planctomycetota bacterium]|jgi:hypothetical protein
MEFGRWIADKLNSIVSGTSKKMALPSEYTIEDAIKPIGNVVAHRANHPIHGKVNIYLPDYTLSRKLATAAAEKLYRDGLRLRELSIQNVPLIEKTLEVSQNPNEPYIVTASIEHDLEEYISNGLTIKAKNIFRILRQVLQAISNLGAVGWSVDRIHPAQIKLTQAQGTQISFSIIEGLDYSSESREIATDPASNASAEKIGKSQVQTVKIAKTPDETPTLQVSIPPPKEHKPNVDIDSGENKPTDSRTTRRNIYLLGTMCYQLLFARKYGAGDKIALENIASLPGRWRRVLNKTLSEEQENRYQDYGTMLNDVRKALNRNRTTAIASIPVWVILILIIGYQAYGRYHRHKIMTSEAGQAIESFLEIVNKTDDEFGPLEKPDSVRPEPNEQTILSPFDKIEPIPED